LKASVYAPKPDGKHVSKGGIILEKLSNEQVTSVEKFLESNKYAWN
jgi:hypothetical protein